MKGRPNLRDKVLAALPGTPLQIVKKTGISISTVYLWTRQMRDEGIIHIGSWKRSKRGSKQPVYVAGEGVNATPPATLTQKQHTKRFKKRNPERFKEIKEAAYYRAKAREKGHGFLATLFI